MSSCTIPIYDGESFLGAVTVGIKLDTSKIMKESILNSPYLSLAEAGKKMLEQKNGREEYQYSAAN